MKAEAATTAVELTAKLGGVDLTIIGAYFVVVLAIGFVIARRTESGEDLFLAGRRLGWLPIGFSLFASNISSTTLIGLAGAAYATGISVSNYEWMATIVLVFFVIFFVPQYIDTRIGTVPELLERRFDRRSRLYFSGLTIFTSIVVDTAGSLYAGAIVLKLFFPGLDLLTTCAILALVAGVYTAAGGLAAVVYTDVIQAIVLFVGSCLLTYLVYAKVGFSWSEVTSVTPAGMLSMIRPLDDPHLPWLGTLIGVPVLGFYFWCTNQFIVQRVLGARSVDHARWGCLLAGLLKLPVLFIMVLPGTIARAIYVGLPRPDLVFPTLVTNLLPVGLVGLVMAGLIAAIMSSVDSTLNSAAALVTLDFVAPRRPNMTPKQTAKVGRFVVMAFMIFAALWAPMIQHFTGLFAYLQQALSYIVPPVVAIFIVGRFWKNGNGNGALSTLVGGHLVSGTIFVLQQTGVITGWHFTIMAGGLFGFCCLLFVVASSLTGSTTEENRSLVYTKGAAGVPSPGWATDYRGQSVVLLLLTAALVISFW